MHSELVIKYQKRNWSKKFHNGNIASAQHTPISIDAAKLLLFLHIYNRSRDFIALNVSLI